MTRLAASLSVLLIATNLIGHSKPDSLVGIWKFAQGYDSQSGTWGTPHPDVAYEIQFFDDGKLSFIYPKGTISGTYIADTTVLPHRLEWQTANPRGGYSKRYAVWTIEGGKLTLKRYRGVPRFPSDLSLRPEDELFDVSELQRESYLGQIKTPPVLRHA